MCACMYVCTYVHVYHQKENTNLASIQRLDRGEYMIPRRYSYLHKHASTESTTCISKQVEEIKGRTKEKKKKRDSIGLRTILSLFWICWCRCYSSDGGGGEEPETWSGDEGNKEDILFNVRPTYLHSFLCLRFHGLRNRSFDLSDT